MFENDYHWLLANENLDFIDDILHYFLPYVHHIMEFWGSMWDFVPYEEYDKIRDSYLDSNASADLIERTDRFHHEIYPSMTQRLRACVDAGINVYIIAGTGNRDIIGYKATGDAIIPTSSSRQKVQ